MNTKRTYKRGDKVVPFQKLGRELNTVHSTMLNSAKAKGQEFLYVMGYEGNGTLVLHYDKIDTLDGDFFRDEDVISYSIWKRNQLQLEVAENIDVLDPGMWYNELLENCDLLSEWWAVANDEGIVAYFGEEKQAWDFRAKLIEEKVKGFQPHKI